MVESAAITPALSLLATCPFAGYIMTTVSKPLCPFCVRISFKKQDTLYEFIVYAPPCNNDISGLELLENNNYLDILPKKLIMWGESINQPSTDNEKKQRHNKGPHVISL